MSIAFSLLPHCATAHASRACRFLCNFDVGSTFVSAIRRRLKSSTSHCSSRRRLKTNLYTRKKEKRKMEEIVTYETLLFALVNFSIARLIVNLNRGANLAFQLIISSWPPLRYLLFFLFSFFFSTLHFTEHNRAAVLIQSSSLLQVTDRGQCWPLIKEVS